MLEALANIFQGFVLVKIGFLIINALYIGFLLVVYKQSRAMQRVITDDGASGLIDTIALVNIIVGVSVFVAALIIL